MNLEIIIFAKQTKTRKIPGICIVQFENYLDVAILWHQLFDQTKDTYFTGARLIFDDASKLKSGVINKSK